MSLRALLIETGALRHIVAAGGLVLWVFVCAALYSCLERLLPDLLLRRERRGDASDVSPPQA